MTRIRWIIMLAVAVLLLSGVFCFAAAAEETATDEWTVMIYFCGSNLESKHGYASENLRDILTVDYPYDEANNYNWEYFNIKDAIRNIGKVNILIETGGSKEWLAKDIGMDIDVNALQRWRYNYYLKSEEDETKVHSFDLMETLPLQSMGDPEPLADFIRWSAKTCPARKYALVLWDHGNAAKGLFIDELFNGDMLYLHELKQALAGGGVHLDTLIIDACQMANIETAWNVKDYADYMVASEENVPGSGTAFKDWLQALVNHPSLDGRWLSHCVCDTTTVKYSNMVDQKSKSLLTWSVTDLSQIDSLVSAFGNYFRKMNSLLTARSPLFIVYTQLLTEEKKYGDAKYNMFDIGSALYNKFACNYVEPQILDPMIDALSKAETYISRGQGRTNAKGLSFCFPAGFSNEDLNIYAKNFPMPVYLAYLDAITPWDAPEEIYTQTERLPEISGIEAFQIKGEKTHTEDGTPALCFPAPINYIFYYNLYRLDEQTGETLLLGKTECGNVNKDQQIVVWATDPVHWPTLEGMLCCFELVECNGSERLYNIPIQIQSEIQMLRCGFMTTIENETSKNIYEVFGVWEGYEENSELLNRSVKPLAMLAGQTYNLLYPRDGKMKNGKISYVKSEEKTMYRSLDIKEEPLPEGTYYLEYEVTDAFMRTTKSERIEFRWDGKKMTFPNDDAWKGSFVGGDGTF